MKNVFNRTWSLYICIYYVDGGPLHTFYRSAIFLVFNGKLDQGCVDKYLCVNSFQRMLFFDVKEEVSDWKKEDYSPPPNVRTTFVAATSLTHTKSQVKSILLIKHTRGLLQQFCQVTSLVQ